MWLLVIGFGSCFWNLFFTGHGSSLTLKGIFPISGQMFFSIVVLKKAAHEV